MNSLRKYTLAVVQLDSTADKDATLKTACEFIDEAASKGAKLVSFPENMNVMNNPEAAREEIPNGPTIRLMAEKAREHNIWLHCGSIGEDIPGDPRKYNTTVLLNPKGEMVAKYRKLHLFDITLPDGRQANESSRNKPGNQMVNVETELGNLGLAICYDIRFPELFRYLRMQGAQILFNPANFALLTGKDHWEVLVRARAIENSCYMVASGQIGEKRPGVYSYGSSMIVDPWGTVLARAKEEPCVITAEIDLDYLDKIRSRMPIENRRTDVYDVIAK